jgi:hypothetical protein
MRGLLEKNPVVENLVLLAKKSAARQPRKGNSFFNAQIRIDSLLRT